MSLSLSIFHTLRSRCKLKNPLLQFSGVIKTSRKGFSSGCSKLSQHGRHSLAPIDEIQEVRRRGFRDLLRPFGFTVMVSGCSFAGCALWQYEGMRSLLKKHAQAHTDQFFGKAGDFRRHMNHYWNRLDPGRQLVVSIIGANVAVFLAWKFRPLQHTMLKWFTSSPYSGAMCSSMLLSAFSHYTVFHLAANMYVLWSFTPTITGLLGKEQFLSMYLSAAVISSFTSYMYKVTRFSKVPSLGASGAIMAVLGAVCSHYPDARLSVVLVDQFLPHSFSAGSAMKFIIALDVAGCLFGWRFFDHAAHLGGMLFGIWYINFGHKIIWKNREPFIKKWHEFRGKT